MSEDKKIVQLPGTKRQGFIEAVKLMVEEIPAQIEYHRAKATIQKQYYDSLIREGFTKEDALFLTSKM